MALDDLAHPFRIKQIGIALRRVLALDQIGVVADRLHPGAGGGVHAVRIDLIGRKMFCDIFGNVGRQPAVLLPVEIMRGIGRVGDVDRLDAAALLLRDALENPLGAGALDAHGDAGIFGLEYPRQPLGGGKLQRRVKRDLAFLARGFDQCRRHRRRRRRRGPQRLGEHQARGGCRRYLEHVASRPFPVPHGHPPIDYATVRRSSPYPSIADIGGVPNDAVHDCSGRREEYSEVRRAFERRWHNRSGEVTDGKVDPFRTEWKYRLRHAGRRRYHGSYRRHVRRREAERRDAETCRRSRS